MNLFNMRGLVSLMHDAGDDGSHFHQPNPALVGLDDGTVAFDGAAYDTWDLDNQPCTHPGCRCLVRWLPDGDSYTWRAVATTRA